MQKLYVFLITVVCIIIIMVVAAFLYIDTHRHHISHYLITVNNKIASTEKIDKYVTEDRIIYRSATQTPFHSIYESQKRKLVLDQKTLRICDYYKKFLGPRAGMDIYFKPVDGYIRFLATGHSNFACLSRFAVDKDFVIFEEDSILSYDSIVSKYNFKKKGLQNFQALTHTVALLPPLKQTIALRLAGEDTISLGEKNIDALNMILKLPDYKEASIWINKWTHSVIKVENPRIGFSATWVEAPLALSAKDYVSVESGCLKKEVSFKNKDIALSGTLTLPENKGPHPAVLLIWGAGPLDRTALGMFTDLSTYLASNGIATLSFDKRGIGKSQGNFSRFTKNETISDLQAALEFLAQQSEIDKTKIIVLGHSEGGFYASYLASANQNIAGCIIMAGMAVVTYYDSDLETIDRFNKFSQKCDKEYLSDINKVAQETLEIIQSGKDWLLTMGKRIYLKKARLDLENKPLDAIRKIKVPILILQGKNDTVILPENAKLLEEALREGGNKNYKVIFHENLDHFFGNIVQDGTYRTYLTMDKKVMENMLEWINNSIIINKKEEEAASEVVTKETSFPQTEKTKQTNAEPAATNMQTGEK